MRIIGGFARGRRLSTPPDGEKTIRPTSDRARESLFNIIGDKIAGAVVLDLFAGTGAFGLEAFSRGAGFVTMVDMSPVALQLIKTNTLKILRGYSGNAEIRVIDQLLFSPLLKQELAKETPEGCDIIFADPPYGKQLSNNTINFINNSRLLRPDGILIVEEKHDLLLPERLSNLHCLEKRSYGDAGFFFYSPLSSS